jgi:hypothetical protein
MNRLSTEAGIGILLFLPLAKIVKKRIYEEHVYFSE